MPAAQMKFALTYYQGAVLHVVHGTTLEGLVTQSRAMANGGWSIPYAFYEFVTSAWVSRTTEAGVISAAQEAEIAANLAAISTRDTAPYYVTINSPASLAAVYWRGYNTNAEAVADVTGWPAGLYNIVTR